MNNQAVLMFVDNLLFSSSSEEDEDESYFKQNKKIRPKIKYYVPNVLDTLSPLQFKEHFRMDPTTFAYLLNLIEADVSSAVYEQGRHTIPAKTQVLFTLWYLSTPECYRSTCERFNIGKATGFRTVRRVVTALCRLSLLFIKWPSGNYINQVKAGFGFPNVIGAIDGSYIPIPAPREHTLSYICRKNFPAVILQAVCDHRLLFTHIYAGEVGSVHDARVLRRSEIWNYITDRDLEEIYFPDNAHLVGDKAYPCCEHLLTPYKDNGHLTEEQVYFNVIMSKSRCAIERAFCLLKCRMRRIKYLDIYCLDWIPKYILACCVVHNICILQQDILEIQEEEINNDVEADGNIRLDLERERQRAGALKQDQICLQLFRNRR